MSKFLQELGQIQQGEVLGGLVREASARLIGKQQEATQRVLSNATDKLAKLDGELLTTEEQLQRLNEDPGVKDSIQDFTTKLDGFRTLTDQLAMREAMYNEAFSNAQSDLAMIGGENAAQASKALSVKQASKQTQLESKIKAELQKQKFLETEIDIANKTMQFTSNKANMRIALEDENTRKVFARMVADPEVQKLATVFNSDTGRKGYNKSELLKSMQAKYGSVGADAFNQAFVMLDTRLEQITRSYNPPVIKTDDSGKVAQQTAMEKLHTAQNTYNFMKKLTDKVGEAFWSSDMNMGQARSEYAYEYDRTYGEGASAKLKPDQYYKDLKVISKMDTPYHKELAKDVYDILYNKQSDINYRQYQKALANLINKDQPLKRGMAYTPDGMVSATGKPYTFKTGQLKWRDEATREVDASEGIMILNQNYDMIDWNPHNNTPEATRHYLDVVEDANRAGAARMEEANTIRKAQDTFVNIMKSAKAGIR